MSASKRVNTGARKRKQAERASKQATQANETTQASEGATMRKQANAKDTNASTPDARLIERIRNAATTMVKTREEARAVEVGKIGRAVHSAPEHVTLKAIATALAREASADATLARAGLSEGMLSRNATLYRVCVLWAGYAPEEVAKYPLTKLYNHVRKARQSTAARVVQSVMRDWDSLAQSPRKAKTASAPAPGGETSVKVTTETKDRLVAMMELLGEDSVDATIARMLGAWETPEAAKQERSVATRDGQEEGAITA